MSADSTGKEQRGRPFEPGQSGNPAGRPKGSRNKLAAVAARNKDDLGELVAKRDRAVEALLDRAGYVAAILGGS